jgi:hypothetical protein
MPSVLRFDWVCPCGASSSTLLEASGNVRCRTCGRVAAALHQLSWAGYIYVLSNVGMPDLLKIGFTMNHPEQRARELSDHTGVPSRYAVEAYFRSAEPRRHEAEIHERLAAQRHAKNREFFAVPVSFALAHCETVTGFAPECRADQRGAFAPSGCRLIARTGRFHSKTLTARARSLCATTPPRRSAPSFDECASRA